jgi:hypothetical protein
MNSILETVEPVETKRVGNQITENEKIKICNIYTCALSF